MEVIAAIALGIATYNYLDSKSIDNQYTESFPGSTVEIVEANNNSNVQWVFIDG